MKDTERIESFLFLLIAGSQLQKHPAEPVQWPLPAPALTVALVTCGCGAHEMGLVQLGNLVFNITYVQIWVAT